MLNDNQRKFYTDDIKINEDELIYSPNISEDIYPCDVFCFYCHKNENNENNPLFKLCKCKNNKQYFHLNCYKTYIKTTDIFGVKNIKLPNLHIMSVYNLICEHCKEPLNIFIKKNKKIYSCKKLIKRNLNFTKLS